MDSCIAKELRHHEACTLQRQRNLDIINKLTATSRFLDVFESQRHQTSRPPNSFRIISVDSGNSIIRPVPSNWGDVVADLPNLLVPVRIHVEAEGHRVVDSFVVNIADTTVNSSHLSRILVQDLDLPDALLGPIEHSITSQIEDAIMYGAGNEYGSLMLILNGSDLENEIVKTAVERILIKLDIVIDSIRYVDQIEWDMTDLSNDPEFVADVLVRELNLRVAEGGLGGETVRRTGLGVLAGDFRTAIAHSIREQIFNATKSILTSVKTALLSEDLFLPVVAKGVRDPKDAPYFQPYVVPITEVEKERREVGRTKRRQTARSRRAPVEQSETHLTSRTPIRIQYDPLPVPQNALMNWGLPKANQASAIGFPADHVIRGLTPVTGTAVPIVVTGRGRGRGRGKRGRPSFASLQKMASLESSSNEGASESASNSTSLTFVAESFNPISKSPPQSFVPVRLKFKNPLKPLSASISESDSGTGEQVGRAVGPSKKLAIGAGANTSRSTLNWKCIDCGCGAMDTPIIRDGPRGPKTICYLCRTKYDQHVGPTKQDEDEMGGSEEESEEDRESDDDVSEEEEAYDDEMEDGELSPR